jgi:rhodanese-related sulfurtransferase
VYQKVPLIALSFLFALFVTGCPEGGINENNNDGGPPQRDSNVDAEPDGDVNPCGDHVCDEAGGEDCTTCERDCLGIACSPVRDITVQEYRQTYVDDPETKAETVIDIRVSSECLSARIPGATYCTELNDWWDGSAITDNGAFLDYATDTTSPHDPLLFYGDGSDDASVLAVAEAAWDFGFDNLYRIVGGIADWRAEGWFQDIAYEGIVAQYYPPTADVFLIDTMDATHYDDCHMQGATNLDTYDFFYGGQLVNGGQALLDVAPDLQNDVLIFFCVNLGCVASEEAAVAAELIGYQQIFHYKEGTEDWISNGGAVVGPACP